MTTTPAADVVPLPAGPPPTDGRRPASLLLLCALPSLLALGMFVSALYDFVDWAPVAALALVAAVIVLMGPGVRLSRPAALVVAGLVLLLAITTASLAWADSVDRAWTEVHRVALYVAVFVTACALTRTREHAASLGPSLAVAVAFPALLALGRVVAGDESAFVQGRLDAPVDYINGVAAMLLIGFWPCVSVALRRDRPLLAGLGLGLAAIEVGLMVLTQSRGAVAALLVCAVVLVALTQVRTVLVWVLLVIVGAALAGLPWTLEVYDDALPRPGTPVDGDLVAQAGLAILLTSMIAGVIWGAVCRFGDRIAPAGGRLAGIAASVLIGAGAVGGVVAVGNPAEVVQEQYDRFIENDTTSPRSVRFIDGGGFRADLWRVALDQFADAPLQGVGAGSYGITYYQRREHPGAVRQPHSLGLQWLSELGVAGGLAFLLFCGGLLWALARAREQAAVLVPCGGAVLGWLVYTNLDWTWNLPAITGLAFVAAAGLVHSDERLRWDPRRHRAPIGLALVVIAALVASLGRQYVAERHQRDAVAAVGTSPGIALRETRKALELDPDAMDARYTRAAAFARFGDYDSSRATLLDAAEQEPKNYVPWALLGDIAVRRGDLGAAREAYRQALRLNPRDAQLRVFTRDPRAALR